MTDDQIMDAVLAEHKDRYDVSPQHKGPHVMAESALAPAPCQALILLWRDAHRYDACKEALRAIDKVYTIDELAEHPHAGDWAHWIAYHIKALGLMIADANRGEREAIDAYSVIINEHVNACHKVMRAEEATYAALEKFEDEWRDARVAHIDAFEYAVAPLISARNEATLKLNAKIILAVVAYYKDKAIAVTKEI